jgi:hypothetical protein
MSRNTVEPDFSSNIIMLTKLRDMKWSMYVEDVEEKKPFLDDLGVSGRVSLRMDLAKCNGTAVDCFILLIIGSFL